MENYLKGLYKPELLKILLKLSTDLEIYQKILDCRIGTMKNEQSELKRLKKQNP